MKVKMYSVYDYSTEDWSIPFGISEIYDDNENGIRRFMYMLIANPEMRLRAADYELRCVGSFETECGIIHIEMFDPDDFDFVMKGNEVVEYLDNPNITTNQILSEIEERRKDVQK